MAIEITTEAVEKSTFVIAASFLDEDGAAVVPNADTIKWTLTNETGGTVINSRLLVAETSASTVNIVLTGNDLEIDSDLDKVRRLVTVQAEYDSNLGSGLTLKESFYFNVINLKRIT